MAGRGRSRAGRFFPTAIVAAILALAPLAGCGRPDFGGYSSNRAGTAAAPLSEDQAADFADQIEADLLARHVQAAIVFRSGRARSKLPKGIAYTHGAFWILSDVRMSDGSVQAGYAVYNLYQGEGRQVLTSSLHQDWPLDFTRGSVVDDVAVVIPRADLQAKLRAVVRDPAYERVHIPDYSLISNPFDARYQNCNEFMLDVIVSQMWPTTNYQSIKDRLRRLNFKPTIVKAGFLTRALGPRLDPRLRADDHSGAIETVTYESMAGFLRAQNLLQAAYSLRRRPPSA